MNEDEVMRREMEGALCLFASTRQCDFVYLALRSALSKAQCRHHHAFAMRVRSMAMTRQVEDGRTQWVMNLAWPEADFHV